MSKPFLKNAWYAAAWSYEVKKELFERTIISESILFYRKETTRRSPSTTPARTAIHRCTWAH